MLQMHSGRPLLVRKGYCFRTNHSSSVSFLQMFSVRTPKVSPIPRLPGFSTELTSIPSVCLCECVPLVASREHLGVINYRHGLYQSVLSTAFVLFVCTLEQFVFC